MVPAAEVASIPAQSSAAIVTKDHQTVTANPFMKPATSCSCQLYTIHAPSYHTLSMQNIELVHRTNNTPFVVKIHEVKSSEYNQIFLFTWFVPGPTHLLQVGQCTAPH